MGGLVMKVVNNIYKQCKICRKPVTRGIKLSDEGNFEVICFACGKKITDIVLQEEEQEILGKYTYILNTFWITTLKIYLKYLDLN